MEVAPNAHTNAAEAAEDLIIAEVPAHTELQAPAPTNPVPDNQPGVADIEFHELNQFKFHIYESSKEGFLTTLFFCLFTSTNIEAKKRLFHHLPAFNSYFNYNVFSSIQINKFQIYFIFINNNHHKF